MSLCSAMAVRSAPSSTSPPVCKRLLWQVTQDLIEEAAGLEDVEERRVDACRPGGTIRFKHTIGDSSGDPADNRDRQESASHCYKTCSFTESRKFLSISHVRRFLTLGCAPTMLRVSTRTVNDFGVAAA